MSALLALLPGASQTRAEEPWLCTMLTLVANEAQELQKCLESVPDLEDQCVQ